VGFIKSVMQLHLINYEGTLTNILHSPCSVAKSWITIV